MIEETHYTLDRTESNYARPHEDHRQRRIRTTNRLFVRRGLCRSCNQPTRFEIVCKGVVRCARCGGQFVTHKNSEIKDTEWADYYKGSKA